LAGGVLELVGAALGARLGGLSGLGLGLVLAATVEALFMSRTVYKTVRSAEGPWKKADQESDRETTEQTMASRIG